MQALSNIYGTKFLVYLGMSQFVMKGLLNMLMGLGFYPIMSSLGVDVQTIELMSLLLFLPWVIKPIIGIIRDRFYSYWLLIQACLIGICGSILLIAQNYLIIKDIEMWLDSPWFIAISFMIINYEIATIDVICEAKYSKLMVENKANLTINIFNQILYAAGVLIATIIVGFTPISFIMIIIIVLAVVPLIPSTVNMIDESSSKKSSDKGLVIISCTITVFAIMLAILLMTRFKVVILSTIIIMYIVLLAMVYMFMNMDTFMFALYLILLSFTWCDTSNALSSYFTSDCGLGYSYEFYITACSSVAFLSSLPLVLYFNKLFGGLRYPILLFIFDNIQNISMAIYLPILTFGFDSRTYTIVAYTMSYIGTTLFTIANMGMFSKCSIKDNEATSFAIIVGIYNMTIMTNIWFSSELYSLFEISNCSYDGLKSLIIIFNIVVPLLVSVPLVLLVPKIYQTESLRVKDVDIELLEL